MNETRSETPFVKRVQQSRLGVSLGHLNRKNKQRKNVYPLYPESLSFVVRFSVRRSFVIVVLNLNYEIVTRYGYQGYQYNTFIFFSKLTLELKRRTVKVSHNRQILTRDLFLSRRTYFICRPWWSALSVMLSEGLIS